MKTAVINLKTRPDRLVAVTEQIHAFGIPDFDVFAAHSTPNALMGNGRSHYELIFNKYDLIFEDDVFFEGTIEILNRAKNQLPRDWDILYLGGNIIEPIKRYSMLTHRCTAAWGSFAILYSEKGRKFVLNNYNTQPEGFIIYDEWLRLQSKQALQAYLVTPPIAWTKGGFSDVNGRVEDYEPGMRKNARQNILP